MRFARAPLVPHDGGDVADGYGAGDEGQATEVIRNGDAKRLLHGEEEFHQVETVDVQIFEQPGIGVDLFAREILLLGDQSDDPELDLPERRWFSGL